jgi:hypothetical protein
MGIGMPRTIASNFYRLVLDDVLDKTHYEPRRTRTKRSDAW